MPSLPKAREMDRLAVTMQPLRDETRLLVMAGPNEILRARLGPAGASHSRAATTLLEGLSLWHQQALSVVLYAEDEATSSAIPLFDRLGFGIKNVHYDVFYALHGHRKGQRIHGFGNFKKLRQLCLEGVV